MQMSVVNLPKSTFHLIRATEKSAANKLINGHYFELEHGMVVDGFEQDVGGSRSSNRFFGSRWLATVVRFGAEDVIF